MHAKTILSPSPNDLVLYTLLCGPSWWHLKRPHPCSEHQGTCSRCKKRLTGKHFISSAVIAMLFMRRRDLHPFHNEMMIGKNGQNEPSKTLDMIFCRCSGLKVESLIIVLKNYLEGSWDLGSNYWQVKLLATIAECMNCVPDKDKGWVCPLQ